jgi:hypothetical protein
VSSRTMMYGSGPGAADVIGISGVPVTMNADGASNPIDVSEVRTALLSAKVGAAPTGSTPTLDLYVDVQDALGNWLQVAHLTQLTGVGYTYATVGPGTGNPYVLTSRARFRWDISAGSSWTQVSVGLAGCP